VGAGVDRAHHRRGVVLITSILPDQRASLDGSVVTRLAMTT
jgi:hypothetical protein